MGEFLWVNTAVRAAEHRALGTLKTSVRTGRGRENLVKNHEN